MESKTFNDKSASKLIEKLELENNDIIFQLNGEFLYSHYEINGNGWDLPT